MSVFAKLGDILCLISDWEKLSFKLLMLLLRVIISEALVIPWDVDILNSGNG